MNNALKKFVKGKMTLQRTAFLIALGVVVVCVGTISATSIYQLSKFASQQNEKTARSEISGIALACQLPMNVGDYDEVQRILDSVIGNDDQIISCDVYDSENNLVASVFNGEIKHQRHESLDDAGPQCLVYRQEIDPMDMDMGLDIGLDVDMNIESLEPQEPLDDQIDSANSTAPVGRIELEFSTKALKQAQQKHILSMITIGLVIGMGTMIAGSLLMHSVLMRLGLLVKAAEKLSLGDYSHETPCLGDDEIGDLGRSFEQMRQAVMLRGTQFQDLNDSLMDKVQERTQELSIAVEEARAASCSKTDFLANMSHEIRTPMTAILGYTELLATEDLTRKERFNYIQTIQRNGNFLLSIINDILDITKVEAGKMTIERIECDLAVLIEEVMSLMRVRSQTKDIELLLFYASPIPRNVMIDPLRTRQILTNLVGNAIKFTDRGAVEIVIGCDALDGSVESPLWIEIHDTGIGMDQEQMGKLFRAFQQADSTMSRKFGGSGLGLCISKSLALLQGGDVTVRSEIGQGSVFTVRLDPCVDEAVEMFMVDPLGEQLDAISNETLKPTADPAKVKLLAGLRILLAEDGLDNQKLISHVLKKAGASVTLAENGQIAVDEYTKTSSEDAPFHLILMDMQMPEMDGYTATTLLRKQGHTIPIIALTAHAMSGDRQRCLDAGCDDYSTKPINRKELIELCKRWAESDLRRSA